MDNSEVEFYCLDTIYSMVFLYNFYINNKSKFRPIFIFLDNTKNKIILSSFLIVFYLFFLITISEIFEDYISRNFIKNVANKPCFICYNNKYNYNLLYIYL